MAIGEGVTAGDPALYAEAESAVRGLGGRSVATAESLTGGYVCGALAAVPGVSEILRGGVVAYQARMKIDVLGVPADLIAAGGTVQPAVAEAMARGVSEISGAELAVATTGVAGPGPAEGHPAGTAFVAVYERSSGMVEVRALTLDGTRQEVRQGCARHALELLARVAEQTSSDAR